MKLDREGRPLLHCKVFIDLEEASLAKGAAAVHAIVTQLDLTSKFNPGKMAVGMLGVRTVTAAAAATARSIM